MLEGSKVVSFPSRYRFSFTDPFAIIRFFRDFFLFLKKKKNGQTSTENKERNSKSLTIKYFIFSDLEVAQFAIIAQNIPENRASLN